MVVEKLKCGHFKARMGSQIGFGMTLQEAIRNCRSLVMTNIDDPLSRWQEERWCQMQETPGDMGNGE